MISQIHKNEKGSFVSIISFIVIVTLLAYFFLFFVFGKLVPPNMIGLKLNYYPIPGLLKGGYEEKGLAPGLHWKIPGISDIILLPRDFQFIQMDEEAESGDLALSKLEIPTADGSKVKTDISLIIRYFSGAGETKAIGTESSDTANPEIGKDVPIVKPITRTHGGPKELVNIYTSSVDRQLKSFSIKAEDSLKRALSTLSTTDYYNPSLREKAAFRATENINQQVNQEGIELWATLIRRYIYAEQKIDDQIFAKNLQDATERLNAAQSELAEARAKTEEVRAEWDGQKIAVLKVDGESQVRVLEEEARTYEAEKVAIADKQIEISKAEIDKEKNQILSSQGGDIYVGRKMIPFISSLKGGIVSGIDPYKVNDWSKKLSGK
jgi:regulator of protease activity HflC (stomatin/prohibitin superfamily)